MDRIKILRRLIAKARAELRDYHREAELMLPMRMRNAEAMLELWEKELRELLARPLEAIEH